MTMKCGKCLQYGIQWVGPLGNLHGTRCPHCGGIDCHIPGNDEIQEQAANEPDYKSLCDELADTLKAIEPALVDIAEAYAVVQEFHSLKREDSHIYNKAKTASKVLVSALAKYESMKGACPRCRGRSAGSRFGRLTIRTWSIA